MNLVCQHECNEKAQKSNSVNAFKATMEQPSRTIVHAKLEMTTPDSPEEVEADAAANDIVQGGKISRSIFAGSAGSGISVSSQMEGRLNSMQGGGQVMPDGLRNMMERGFNRDFSQVRLHTDSEAASLSSSINAKAFTHGNDIYFNQGQFSPNTSEGQKLMAHELTHVVQGGGKVGRDTDNDPCNSHYVDNNNNKVEYMGNNKQCNYYPVNRTLLKSMIDNAINALDSVGSDTYITNLFHYCFVNPLTCPNGIDYSSFVSVVRSKYTTIKNSIDTEKVIDGENLRCGGPTTPGYAILGCTSYDSKNNNVIFIDKNIINSLYPNDSSAVYHTIIHEIAHEKAGAHDYVYFSEVSKYSGNTLSNPLTNNADSYSTFAEFVHNRTSFNILGDTFCMSFNNPNGIIK